MVTMRYLAVAASLVPCWAALAAASPLQGAGDAVSPARARAQGAPKADTNKESFLGVHGFRAASMTMEQLKVKYNLQPVPEGGEELDGEPGWLAQLPSDSKPRAGGSWYEKQVISTKAPGGRKLKMPTKGTLSIWQKQTNVQYLNLCTSFYDENLKSVLIHANLAHSVDMIQAQGHLDFGLAKFIDYGVKYVWKPRNGILDDVQIFGMTYITKNSDSAIAGEANKIFKDKINKDLKKDLKKGRVDEDTVSVEVDGEKDKKFMKKLAGTQSGFAINLLVQQRSHTLKGAKIHGWLLGATMVDKTWQYHLAAKLKR